MKQFIYNTLLSLNYWTHVRRQKLKLYCSNNIGILTGEFFNKDLGGFGGYGKTTQNLSNYFNKIDRMFNVKVLLAETFGGATHPTKTCVNDTDVILPGNPSRNYLSYFHQYQKIISDQQIRLLITIDLYSSYRDVLEACPHVPVLIWIRDPRSVDELKKIITVEEEFNETRHKSAGGYLSQAKEREDALKDILNLSKVLKRKIIFASNAEFLTERARRMFNMPNLTPHVLHNPVPVPKQRDIFYSEKPSLCFIGRNAAVKRVWIVYALAKRFPHVDFYFAGISQDEAFNNPKFAQYKSLPNLKFLGIVDDKEKFKLLRQTWGLINTSIHEGYPVTFQEAFAFGKCVVSCQNPEQLTERFGFYTGEILGAGMDKNSLDKFSLAIEKFISNRKELETKGRQAQNFFDTHHSFERFNEDFQTLLSREGLI